MSTWNLISSSWHAGAVETANLGFKTFYVTALRRLVLDSQRICEKMGMWQPQKCEILSWCKFVGENLAEFMEANISQSEY